MLYARDSEFFAKREDAELRPRKMTLNPMRDAAQDIRADKSQKSFMRTEAKKQQRTITDTKCMRAM